MEQTIATFCLGAIVGVIVGAYVPYVAQWLVVWFSE